jgi:uncharacterized membrane protein
MESTQFAAAPGGRSLWSRIRHIHPGLVLAALDLVGLTIASYLAEVELQGKTPQCVLFSGCETVATSSYARPFFGIPVAVYGVFLSITLFFLAIAWWKTGNYKLLLAHYALSLVGVLFEGWFQYVQLFKIKAFCVYCESYGLSLLLRFVIAFWVFIRTPNPDRVVADD